MGEANIGTDSAAPRKDGLKRLSPRQRQCLTLVAEGLTTKEIAKQLGLEPGSVDTYIAGAVKALGARGRYHAADLLRGTARNPELQNLGLAQPSHRLLDQLPFRRKGAIGNDLPILLRLFWIVALAFGFAVAFGMFAVGARVVSDFVRAIAS